MDSIFMDMITRVGQRLKGHLHIVALDEFRLDAGWVRDAPSRDRAAIQGMMEGDRPTVIMLAWAAVWVRIGMPSLPRTLPRGPLSRKASVNVPPALLVRLPRGLYAVDPEGQTCELAQAHVLRWPTGHLDTVCTDDDGRMWYTSRRSAEEVREAASRPLRAPVGLSPTVAPLTDQDKLTLAAVDQIIWGPSARAGNA